MFSRHESWFCCYSPKTAGPKGLGCRIKVIYVIW
jgi:hypothetical protein